MNKELSKKQRLKIVLDQYQRFCIDLYIARNHCTRIILINLHIYQETDIALEQAVQDTRLVQAEINNANQNEAIALPAPNTAMPKIPGTNRFNTQFILWSEDGTIVNKQSLGGRFSQLASLKLDTEHLNTIQSLTVSDQNEAETLLFHSITVAAPTNQSGVAYVQVLANTNQINNAMNNFQNNFDFIDDFLLDLVNRYQLLPFFIDNAADPRFVEKTARICRKCFS